MLLEDLGLVVEAEEHRDPGTGDQGPKGRRRHKFLFCVAFSIILLSSFCLLQKHEMLKI